MICHDRLVCTAFLYLSPAAASIRLPGQPPPPPEATHLPLPPTLTPCSSPSNWTSGGGPRSLQRLLALLPSLFSLGSKGDLVGQRVVRATARIPSPQLWQSRPLRAFLSGGRPVPALHHLATWPGSRRRPPTSCRAIRVPGSCSQRPRLGHPCAQRSTSPPPCRRKAGPPPPPPPLHAQRPPPLDDPVGHGTHLFHTADGIAALQTARDPTTIHLAKTCPAICYNRSHSDLILAANFFSTAHSSSAPLRPPHRQFGTRNKRAYPYVDHLNPVTLRWSSTMPNPPQRPPLFRTPAPACHRSSTTGASPSSHSAHRHIPATAGRRPRTNISTFKCFSNSSAALQPRQNVLPWFLSLLPRHT